MVVAVVALTVVDVAISRLTTLLRGLQQAADEAGNKLAKQIDEHRAEWQESLDETRDAAAARYDAAISEARAALAELIRPRPQPGNRQGRDAVQGP